MKKLVTLLLAAGLVFSAANASAVEVQASGRMDFAFDAVDSNDFLETQHRGADKHETHFGAAQRLRVGMDFIVSENLSGTYQFQVGTFQWGGSNAEVSENAGGALGTRANNISTRLAYLDWMVPNTSVKVRMGQQIVTMPSFVFGSPVLDNTATGILVAAPVTDMVDVTAGWLRAYSGYNEGDKYYSHKAGSLSPSRTHDLVDLFYLNANVHGNGFQVSPWALMGPVGKHSAIVYDTENKQYESDIDNGFAWFAGIGGELTMFDPFRFAADFYYSSFNADGVNGEKDLEQSGWYAALAAEYETAYGTGALRGWYASGDDKDDGDRKSHQPLTLAGAFNPTTSFFDGVWGIGSNIDRCDASGTWGVGLYWSGLSFVQNLTHDFAVVYFQGTNDKKTADSDPIYQMTTKDSAVELDFTTTYQIYDNLATALELSYIFQDFDTNLADRAEDYQDNFRATLNFKYTF